MQAIVETVFDAAYLVSVITIGILMIRGSKGNPQFRLFGLMAVVLGAGDSFHLIPRALALCTTGLENYTVPLGLGKWITSVTMTMKNSIVKCNNFLHLFLCILSHHNKTVNIRSFVGSLL